MSISLVLEDIDPISKIFKNVLDGSSGCFGPRLFKIFKMFDFYNLNISKNIISQKGFVFSWIILSNLVYPELDIIGFGSHGDVR